MGSSSDSASSSDSETGSDDSDSGSESGSEAGDAADGAKVGEGATPAAQGDVKVCVCVCFRVPGMRASPAVGQQQLVCVCVCVSVCVRYACLTSRGTAAAGCVCVCVRCAFLTSRGTAAAGCVRVCEVCVPHHGTAAADVCVRVCVCVRVSVLCTRGIPMLTVLYHLYVGGVNSAFCGHRIVSTLPDSKVHKVIQHALHCQHWDPPRICVSWYVRVCSQCQDSCSTHWVILSVASDATWRRH